MKTQVPVFKFNIQNKANEAVDIFIDGGIVDAETEQIFKEYFGDETTTSYKSFRDKIDVDKYKKVNVYINSPGGIITDAMAIHDLIVEMESKGITVNTIGRGIIASAATYILMASKNSEMSENSWLMIHNVSGIAYGDVNDVENQARAMRKFNDQVTGFYSNATGLSETVVKNLMDKETWLTANEAKEKGFVKNVSGNATFSNTIQPDQWLFNNKAVLNSYNSNTKNMDFQKITDAINAGFEQVKNALGIKGEEQVTNEALTAFTNSIVTVIKDNVPTNESIQNMVDEAVNKIEKPANLVTTNQIENFATKDEIANLVNKDDLTTSLDTLKNSFIEKIGDKSREQPANTAALPKNKYANANFNA